MSMLGLYQKALLLFTLICSDLGLEGWKLKKWESLKW